MPIHSQHCLVCPWSAEIDVAAFVNPDCPACGGTTERLWVGRTTTVVSDEFAGGKTFENLGDTPVTVYSKSELRREMQARGLEEFVRHVPVPGSDKSPHTTNWDVPSQRTLDNARALLERVGAPVAPTRREPEGVGPLATPALVKQVAEAWH